MLLNIKSGVLIIGSLFWQDYLNKKGDNIRLNWRNSRLDFEKRIHVKVPIRYGRISSSKIPTMVFSNSMKDKLGFGYLVPFKKIIRDENELLNETLALSTAEGMRENFVTSWGVLAYLFNEEKISKDIRSEIVKFFKERKKSKF